LDVVEEHYATRAEAQQRGNGWLPKWVPSNAHDIHDVHNVDTIDQILTFSVPPFDIPAMVAELLPLEEEHTEAARNIATSVGWRRQSQQALEAYYVCSPNTAGVLFVDRRMGRALYKQWIHWAAERCRREQPSAMSASDPLRTFTASI
jgi:hypothetical protein